MLLNGPVDHDYYGRGMDWKSSIMYSSQCSNQMLASLYNVSDYEEKTILWAHICVLLSHQFVTTNNIEDASRIQSKKN